MAYQEAPDPPVTPELRAACADALHVITNDGVVLRGARALLFVGDRLGWRGARLAMLPPVIWILDGAYWVVAEHRSFFARFFFRTR